jgi:glycosyltransferase involved in cell wall biosynthesis
VLLEAMASGKPLITTRIGGIPDVVVDGETGLLVPPGDAAALRKALVRLVEDGEMRVRFGEAGRRRVVRFQASAVITNLESIYQEVSGLPRGSGFPVDPERSYE